MPRGIATPGACNVTRMGALLGVGSRFGSERRIGIRLGAHAVDDGPGAPRPWRAPDRVDDGALHLAERSLGDDHREPGRSTIYLGSLSASLVTLALIAQGESTVADSRLFALLILPGLFFLGTVTFVRIVRRASRTQPTHRQSTASATTTSRWRAKTPVTSHSAVMTTWRACSPTWASPPPAGDRSSAWRA